MRMVHNVLTIALAVLLITGAQGSALACSVPKSACADAARSDTGCCVPTTCQCEMSAPTNPQQQPESTVATTPTGFGHGKGAPVHGIAIEIAGAATPASFAAPPPATPHPGPLPLYSLTHAFLI